MFTAIFLTILITLTITILILNMKSPGKRIEHNIKAVGRIDSPVVTRSIAQLLGPPLVKGNSIESLHNGDQIFEAMLTGINSAKKTITFETFIYWSGDIGNRFAEALTERARAGVKVHVLLDWLGSRSFEESYIEEMKSAGVQVQRYRPIRWYNIARVNNRTHRKILVIDGLIGFVGGVGIADQWLGNAQDKDHWRDSHFKIKGPVVAQLQAAFMDNWNASHPDVLHGDDYFPLVPEVGDAFAQVFKSSPEEGSGSVRLMYLYSISHAMKTIRISTAYFVPDTHLRKVLIDAAKRGVKIEVILPGPIIDTHITRRASRSVWGDLLKAGIRIYEYQPTMYHCKFMIVDELWASVGSTNLDHRSLRLNDECNLNAIEPKWALEMSEVFEKDKARTIEMTYEQWKSRPLNEKIIEFVSSILKSQV